jgi:hypothetical protein
VFYTERGSKIGRWQGGALNLSQAPGVPKDASSLGLDADAEEAKLKKFSDAGGLKFSGCPTQPEPILEFRAVYVSTSLCGAQMSITRQK